jgi:hypothetical protein
MGGTARVYTTADIAHGPVHLFSDVATPASGAELVIDVTGGYPSPDATANPSAVHWGLTTGGAELLYKPTTQMSEADELTSPYRTSLVSEEVVISPKGVLRVGQDFTLLSEAILGGTLSTPSGKKKVDIGGLTTVTMRTFLAIWAQYEDSTKYCYWLLYSAFNDNGLALTLSRKADASSDLAWRGFSVSSRTVGQQICQIVKTT